MLDSTFVLFGDYDLSGSRDGHVANPSSFERVKKVFKTGTCVLPRFGWVFPVRCQYRYSRFGWTACAERQNQDTSNNDWLSQAVNSSKSTSTACRGRLLMTDPTHFPRQFLIQRNQIPETNQTQEPPTENDRTSRTSAF